MFWLFPGGIYGSLLHLMAALVLVFLFFGSFLQIYKAGDFIVSRLLPDGPFPRRPRPRLRSWHAVYLA